MKQFLCIITFVLSGVLLNAQPVYSILDFGAKGDGKTINTPFIQKAIDQCASNGGGTVVIPSGTFMTGTVFLKSNVILSLEPAAILLGASELEHYKNEALIYAENLENIAITGSGTINGNGAHPNFHSDDPLNGIAGRPNTIKLKNCRFVKLSKFILRDGARWCIHLIGCRNVTVHGLSVISRVVANNDGIDIQDCQNVCVSDCYFDCGDDAVCPKSDSPVGVKNLTITNCIIKSESNGIKFGTASVGGFRDVTISNCVIYDTRLSGIALEMVDGGVMERININNIVMHRVDGAVFIKLGRRKGNEPGKLRNIMITNLTADSIGMWKPETQNTYFKDDKDPRIGVSIVGQPGFDVENITLSNISMQFAGGGTQVDAELIMADAPTVYPEYTNFGVTPAYGLNCRHVKNLFLDNIQLSWINEDARPALFFEDAKDIGISGIRVQASAKAGSFIRLKDSRHVFIQNCKPDLVNIPFVSLEGQIHDISLVNNDMRKLEKTYIAAPSVNADEIFEK